MVARVSSELLSRPPRRLRGARALACALACLTVLAGCGSTLRTAPAAHITAESPTPGPPSSCAEPVLATFTSILKRVYHEGISSERTASASHLITHSVALREAVESGNRGAAHAAARALLATGHMTNVTVVRGSHPLVSVGGPALAPLRGTITSATGAPIATYLASVWADEGFLSEAGGITQGIVALRTVGAATPRAVGDSPALPAGVLADEGALMRAGVAYRYTSFPVQAYPSGALRVYTLIPDHTIAAFCGATREDTVVNTLQRVAALIYAGETGRSAHNQVRRAQRNKPLLEAVARRDSVATRAAIVALLNQHIVRMRVSSSGQLISDVGGPYVLGPVDAPLRLGGHTIGELTLSIQDDEGYLRLARRLAGLDVLMYAQPEGSPHPQLVKNSLGPAPGPALASVPVSGPFRYEGRPYRVFTLHVQAFPSGPLVIRVLVPLPYL